MSFRSDRRPSSGGGRSGGGRPSSGGRPPVGGRSSGSSRPFREGRPSREGRFSSEGRPPGQDRPFKEGRSPSVEGGGRPFADRRLRDRRQEERPSAGRGSFRRSDDRFRRDRSDRSSSDWGGARPWGGDQERPGRDSEGRDGGSRERNSRDFNSRDNNSRDRSGLKRFSSRPERSRPDQRRFSSQRPWTQDDRAPAPQGESSSHAADGPADDLLWGRHATQAVLEAGRPIHRIWCTSELRSAPRFLQLLREAKGSGVLVEEVTWARLGQITGGAVHQGIALQTASAETLDLPTLIEGCAALEEPPLLLALDGLTDPQNLGAIVRSAEALGAHGVVLPQRRSAGLTGSVAKVAAGALEHLPVARVVNLNRSLETLKDAGYRVVGLAEEGDVTLAEADLEGSLVVVTGSEGDGLSLLTRRHCDQLIRIPLRGVTPSLNASVATAMCLYEIARRGWMKDLRGQAPSPPIRRPRVGTGPTPEPTSEPTPESRPESLADAQGLDNDGQVTPLEAEGMEISLQDGAVPEVQLDLDRSDGAEHRESSEQFQSSIEL